MPTKPALSLPENGEKRLENGDGPIADALRAPRLSLSPRFSVSLMTYRINMLCVIASGFCEAIPDIGNYPISPP